MSKPGGTLCLRAIHTAAAAKKGKRNRVKAPADFGDMLGSQVLWVEQRSWSELVRRLVTWSKQRSSHSHLPASGSTREQTLGPRRGPAVVSLQLRCLPHSMAEDAEAHRSQRVPLSVHRWGLSSDRIVSDVGLCVRCRGASQTDAWPAGTLQFSKPFPTRPVGCAGGRGVGLHGMVCGVPSLAK